MDFRLSNYESWFVMGFTQTQFPRKLLTNVAFYLREIILVHIFVNISLRNDMFTNVWAIIVYDRAYSEGDFYV